MPYRALQPMFLGEDVFPGDILTPEQLKGRDANVLIRLSLAEYFQGEAPAHSFTPKRVEAKAPTVDVEEIPEIVKEKPSVPVKAEVSKHGVWYKVFAGPLQIGKPTRDEKQAKKIAKDFNEKL